MSINAKQHQLLFRLIVAAEEVINRAACNREHRSTTLETLRAEIKRDLDIAAPDGRYIHDEDLILVQLLQFIERARRHGDDRRVTLWSQAAGLFLPMSREHMHAALMGKPV